MSVQLNVVWKAEVRGGRMARNRRGAGQAQFYLPSQYAGYKPHPPSPPNVNVHYYAQRGRHVQKQLWGSARGHFRTVGNFGASGVMG